MRRAMFKALVRNIHWCAVAVVLASGVSSASADPSKLPMLFDFLFKASAEKGFVAVDDLKTDVILLLADGRKLALGKVLPEYEPTIWGSPLPIDKLELDGVQDVWRNLFRPFDYNQDNTFEKPEMAMLAIAMATRNKGFDIINASVNGFIVNGLDVTFRQEYGLEALTRKVPARDAAARERRRMMVEMDRYFNVDESGGGGAGGGGGGGNGGDRGEGAD